MKHYQHGPVWFLAGTSTTGPVTCTVTVPDGKALFFPIINTLWWTAPADPPTSIRDSMSALAGPLRVPPPGAPLWGEHPIALG